MPAFEAKTHFIAGAKYPLAKDAQAFPPLPCEHKVGDRVAFTNDYGVTFHNQVVTGFASTVEYGRFVFLDIDSWWFPVRPENLTKQPQTGESPPAALPSAH